ncbi:MAG TPA: FAD-binding protein, partial [Thermoanaerobaculia bacterium]|nr:FAD-binding protein [Thermoanaerobaculia bacterium]
MFDRREFLKLAALAAAACATQRNDEGTWVNDIHSQLNKTWVSRVRKPASTEELRRAIRESRVVCTAGGRHAMGGQQFATDATLLDMNAMTRVLSLDESNGI